MSEDTNAIPNIFELGMLVVVETHSWQATRKIPPNAIGVQSEWVNSTKRLVDSARLKEINLVISQIRHYLYQISLPFPLKGMLFIPRDSILKVEERLRKFQDEFKEKVDKFISEYDIAIAEAKLMLGDTLFSETDYPTDIRSKFYIAWKFVEMAVPGKLHKISPEVYREEIDKFKAMMEDARHMAILALREGFAETLTSVVGVLTGKVDGVQKRVHNDTLEKINRFFEEFQSKNVFKDKELQKLIADAQEIICDVDIRNLKDSDALATFIAGSLSDVQTKLAESITEYKRSMSI